jgi:hypothetical protein
MVDSLNSIIAHLTTQRGGATPSTELADVEVPSNDGRVPENVLFFEGPKQDEEVALQNTPNQWICFSLKLMRVIWNHNTISLA